MIKIQIEGLAVVHKDNEQISDPTLLASLLPLAYQDEIFTDYLGGAPLEDSLTQALKRSGHLIFSHTPGADLLTVTVEFLAHRPLTRPELDELVQSTLGQWSDGIGENWTSISPSRIGYSIMCLTPGDGPLSTPYPTIRIS